MKALVQGVVLATVLVSASPVRAGEKAYEIVMDRSTTVGATYGIIAKGHSHETLLTSAGGQVLEEKNNELLVELTASVTVLELESRGRPSTLKLVIESSSVRRGELSAELLPSGTEVVASVEEGTESYTIAGEPVGADVVKALALVNSLPLADETDDDVFGTPEKKRVGDSWPVNAKLAAKSFRDSGLVITDEAVTGESKLTGVTRIGKSECLKLEGKIEMTGIEAPLPAGFKTVDARLEASFSGTYPVDPSRAKLDKSLRAAVVFKAVGKAEADGPDITIALTSERTSSTKFVY